MLNLVTDFEIHITYNKDDMGKTPVSFDGTTFTWCDACYELASAAPKQYSKVMDTILTNVNRGHTYGMFGKTMWRLIAI